MKKILEITIALVATTLLVPAAAYHIGAADEGVALRVYNGDSSATLSILIGEAGAAATNAVAIGAVSTAIDGSGAGADTITEFAAAIVACTNAAGNAVLTVDKDCALDADSTDGELLDGTYTAVAGAWLELLWDSSENEQLDVYIPPASNPGFVLQKIYGNPVGTGPLTWSIYRNQSLAMQGIVELSYALNTNDAATALSANIELPIDAGIYMKRGEGVFLRAVRTTMTGGNIGFTAD